MKKLSVIDGLYVLSKKDLINLYKHVYEQGCQNGVLIEAGIGQDNLTENLNVFLKEQEQLPAARIKKSLIEICPFYSDPDFKTEWKEFEIVRKRKKASITERSTGILLKKMMDISKGEKQLSIDIVKQSYLAGWSDIYALKSQKNGTGVKQSRENVWRDSYSQEI